MKEKKTNAKNEYHLRVSADLKNQIKIYAEENYISETDVIVLTLRKFFTNNVILSNIKEKKT